ncbi:MAG: MgtC/SapB family protein, partial [Chloroflexi bacterium]|nr:MgtC/SapB family protein [Chloroflexota bacterium]
MPQYTDIFYRFGIALVIGFLVGLQRQHASDASDKEIFAGVRTFSLISVLGCGAAMLADVSGSAWTLPVIAAMLGVLAAVAYYINAIDGDTGVTTE